MDKLLPPEEELRKLLDFVTKNQASDLHLKVGYSPIVRLAGKLRTLQIPPLPDTKYIDAMMAPFVPETRKQEYLDHGTIDFSAPGPTGDRFRINMYRSTGTTHVAIRRVQSEIPDFESLNLPDIYRQTVEVTFEGLVLVCGVTGCGKSSTLAAMLNYINHHRSLHIITIEDPIEYAFRPKLSIISQREVGIDVPGFAEALRSVVRQDPDCILVGEMRDRETMMAGLQAAETGHLVLGSLHCSDARQTFSRILEFFPRDEHAFIRSSMASSLKAIMVQRLIPSTTEGVRYPATEVLLGNPIVREKILREEDKDLPAVMTQCREEGMRTFTDSLCELVEAEHITREKAMEYAPNQDALKSRMRGIETF